MAQPLYFLIVEDSPDDAELLVRELRHNQFDPQHRRVDSAADMRAALQERAWDVIISDYAMPGFTGLDALQIAREHDRDIPFIIVSGTIGEQLAVAAMKAGAHDYLMKENLLRLGAAVERELREAQVRRQRRQAEAELVEWQRELEVRVEERTSQLTLAHKKLRAAMQERRRLEGEIIRAVEREQLKLGQQLHDGLGQQLTGISYMLSSVKGRAPATLSPEMHKLELLLQQCVEQTRHLSKQFYPVDMDNLGLLVALDGLAREMVFPPGATCTLEYNNQELCDRLKGPAAVQMFRVAQEAVHNAIRHSKATRITMVLEAGPGHILLLVRDNGIGFSPDVAMSHGMGVHLMRHRAETEGGTLAIENDPKGGAVVCCSLPLSAFNLPAQPRDSIPQSSACA